MKHREQGQMSESWILGIFLTISGGFQDAYSYVCRGGVFANAQTGNIVLLGKYAAEGQWHRALHYAIPILAFVGGIFLAQSIQLRLKQYRRVHWRQWVLMLEILILFFVGLLPAGGAADVAGNALVSLSCAMQVDSFRKIRGNALATTMCIGNLRSATALLCAYRAGGNEELKWKSLQYYMFIGVFLAGAVLGNGAVAIAGTRAVWWCCLFLFSGLLLMFVDREAESVSGKR